MGRAQRFYTLYFIIMNIGYITFVQSHRIYNNKSELKYKTIDFGLKGCVKVGSTLVKMYHFGKWYS